MKACYVCINSANTFSKFRLTMPDIYIQRAHQNIICLSAYDPLLLEPPAVAHLGEVEVGALGVELEVDRL